MSIRAIAAKYGIPKITMRRIAAPTMPMKLGCKDPVFFFFFKKQENELVEHILAMDSILRHYATGQVFGPTPGAASDSYSVPLPEFRFRSRTSFQHHLRTSFRSRFWTSYQTRYRTSWITSWIVYHDLLSLIECIFEIDKKNWQKTSKSGNLT